MLIGPDMRCRQDPFSVLSPPVFSSSRLPIEDLMVEKNRRQRVINKQTNFSSLWPSVHSVLSYQGCLLVSSMAHENI